MSNNIKTLGELKKSGYKPKSIKDEIRDNLVKRLQKNQPSFDGILGYEETVIPDVERACRLGEDRRQIHERRLHE